jgi:hypothetical protein
VVDVLLLLAEELGTDSIESVTAELVVALDNLQHIHLQSTINVDGLGVTLAKGLGRKVRVAHLGANA